MVNEDTGVRDVRLSRRTFLGSAAVGAAAIGGTVVAASALGAGAVAGAVGGAPKGISSAALGGASRRATPLPIPTKWEYSADVVVVGYGGAGAVAAITAFDAGANVLIVEKTPTLSFLGVANTGTQATSIQGGGGNTHISGGIIFMPLDPIQGAIWHYNMGYGATPMAVSQAWAEMGVQNKAWLTSMNIPFNYSSTVTEYGNIVPGVQGGFASCTPTGGGAGFFYYLDQLVQQRGIPVVFNTRAQELYQDPSTGEVIGLQALQNQVETVNIQANKAVILTTGGFEFDANMKLNYLKTSPYHFGGWQYNTGDGIKMALKAGAGLWHMNTTSGRYSPWIPTYNTAWAQEHHGNAWFWTDRYGNRFCNESALPSHSTWQVAVDWNFTYAQYSRVPAIWILDSTGAGQPIAGGEDPRRVTRDGSAPLPEQVTTSTTTTTSSSTVTQLVYGTGINQLPVQLGGTGALASAGFTGTAVGTPWSNTNQAEVAAGFVITGSTIAQLAANIAAANIIGSNQGMAVPAGWYSAESMDNVTIPEAPGGGFGGTNCRNYSAANLQAAINQWNTDVAAGKGDTVYGRAASTMAAIQTPPYYAIALWPAGPNTNGGPIRDQYGHICDPDYNPIPRLYGGGELGSVWGFLYMTGGNNGES
ncbi:MAG: FAD-binding protein, partial [Nitrososphaerales archaeon]